MRMAAAFLFVKRPSGSGAQCRKCPNGEGARNLADAFARWKMDGGKWMTTGLSGKFNPEKYAAFVKIVERYRQNLSN